MVIGRERVRSPARHYEAFAFWPRDISIYNTKPIFRINGIRFLRTTLSRFADVRKNDLLVCMFGYLAFSEGH